MWKQIINKKIRLTTARRRIKEIEKKCQVNLLLLAGGNL